ncbi:MAG: hypothetical protein IJ036_01780 [Lachnospiraceae bacterium]|nr:hypothetical protein [Lachnospiraceae bacterium]
MKEKLMNNFSLKILSVVAAVLLWLVVVNVDDPITTETYSGIKVTMVNENAITSREKVYKIVDESNVISLSVRAKRSVHKDLTNADFVATADMEKDIQFDNLVAINVTCTNREVEPSDITKSRNNVKVSIEDAATETFNVVVKQKGTPGTGYVVGDMVPSQRVLSVTGPASLVAKIKRFEAEVDVTGRTGDDTVVSSLKVVGNDGEILDSTNLTYNGKSGGMTVKITMFKIKEVPLKMGVSGTPAKNYRFVGINFNPEKIEIAGAADNLKVLTNIRIPDEAVNIEGLSQTTELELDLTSYLPEGIRLVDEADKMVAVTVVIEGKETREIEVPVENIKVTNVAKGYSVSFGKQETVAVPVTGYVSDLDALKPEEIEVTLNAYSMSKAGTYKKTLKISVPEQFVTDGKVEISCELQKASS